MNQFTKRFIMVVLLAGGVNLLAVPVRASSDTPVLSYMDTPASLNTVRELDHRPFAPGEKIKLKATYLGLTAGYIEMTVKSDTVGGRQLYKLDLRASTSGMVDYLYSLRDRFVSYVDRKGLFSWGYDYHQLHNGENKTRNVRYFHREGFFTENGERKSSIPKYTQDLLSGMYFLRTLQLDDGDTFSFPAQTGDDSYDVNLKVNDTVRVATKNGWKDAYELKPILKKSQQKQAAREHVESISGIRIWLSTDERRIPLKISFPATFGHLNAFLEEYSAP